MPDRDTMQSTVLQDGTQQATEWISKYTPAVTHWTPSPDAHGTNLNERRFQKIATASKNNTNSLYNYYINVEPDSLLKQITVCANVLAQFFSPKAYTKPRTGTSRGKVIFKKVKVRESPLNIEKLKGSCVKKGVGVNKPTRLEPVH